VIDMILGVINEKSTGKYRQQ